MNRRGFTLLEVMVAIAILGLALTAILSAQAGAFAAAAHARNISVATGLARCKMTELEERLVRDGFQELDEADSGPCCEGDETPNMTCSWKVEKPELPEPKYGELNLDTDVGSADLGALGELSKSGGSDLLGPDAKLGDVSSLLGGAGAPEGAAGAAQGMLGMLMEMVYPDIRSFFEASTRRITVKMMWKEGVREHSFEITQWFAIPQKGAPPKEQEGTEAEEEAPSTGKGKSDTPPRMVP